MRDATRFHKQVQNIIDDPATSDALRTYARSARDRDPVDILAELEVLRSAFEGRVRTLLSKPQ